MALTKTGFMRGIQCRKMLWLDWHKPSLQVIPQEIQERLDAGNAFGDRAMGMFGDFEEMTVFRPGTRVPDKKAMLANTVDALERGVNVICEAAFSFYNNYCAIDILRRTPEGYDLCEVKNSPELAEQYIRDAAYQFFIASRCGLKIRRICIVLHGPDEEQPFLMRDVTNEVRSLYGWVNEHIWDLNRKAKEKEEPQIAPGRQCTEPYLCWYFDYCHGTDAKQEEQA